MRKLMEKLAGVAQERSERALDGHEAGHEGERAP